MGEVAEMMLDGTLCAGCGVFLNEDTPGYPCYCEDCKDEETHMNKKHPLSKVKCSVCNRKVKEVGLKDHMRDAHGK